MDSPRIHALAPEHIPFIVEACANWRELAQWGAAVLAATFGCGAPAQDH